MGLGKHIFGVGFFTGISRVFGFVRDLMIAQILGAGRASDIFFAAFKLPNMFRDLLGEGALSSVFIPMFTNEKKSSQFASNVFSWLMVVLLSITVIAQIIMPIIIFIMAPGFGTDAGKLMDTVFISRIMFFYVIFICGSAFLSSILNAFSKFALVAMMPILMNVFMICGLIIASKYNETALIIMACAVVLSGIVQMFILISRLRAQNFGLRLIIPRFDAKIKTVLKRFGTTIVGSGFYQINVIVGTLVASFQSGAVSWLYYSDRIIQLPFAIIGLAAGTVLMTSLSKSIAEKNMRAVYLQQNSVIKNSMMLTIPCCVGLFVLAHPIIKNLFEYGAWGPESTTAVSLAIMIACWALPLMVMNQIYSKTLYAASDVKTPVKTSIIALFISAILYIGLFPFVGYLSVPIGSVVGGFIRNNLMLRECKKRSLFKLERGTIISVSFFALLSAVVGLIVWFIPTNGILWMIISMTVFGILYLPIAYIFNKKVKIK